MSDERIICYLGPSLDLETARGILPHAQFRPPAKHADIISDIFIYAPTHIILIDGEFSQSLSVWQKELVYALLHPGIQGVYGAASMGALRAAELADYGMVGIGKIFWWYYESVIEGDEEVALLYHQDTDGHYILDTEPLVDVRGFLLNFQENKDDTADKIWERLSRKHWTERKVEPFLNQLPRQKREDAIECLKTFRDVKPLTDRRPSIEDLSPLFMAMFERDRMIEVDGVRIPLQNIDSWIATEDWDQAEIIWNAQNRALVLVLADLLGIFPTDGEKEREAVRFMARHFRCKPEEFNDRFKEWLEANHMTAMEFDLLMFKNARIRKLQHALCSTMMYRRRTQAVLDHLRTHNQIYHRIQGCAEAEKLLMDKDSREFIDLDPGVNLPKLIAEHLEATGMWIDGDLSEYLKETGIGSSSELHVVLQRSKFARKISSDLNGQCK